MPQAKAINMRVRPLQSVDLSFPTDGLIATQRDPHLLGKVVTAFDLDTFYSKLGTVVTPIGWVPPDPKASKLVQVIPRGPLPDHLQPLGWGRLQFDSRAIRAELDAFILFELRAEPTKAALDKAIGQRENIWVQKYESAVYEATCRAYDPSAPDSMLSRIQRLAQISRDQHAALRAAYADFSGKSPEYGFDSGVVKAAVTVDTVKAAATSTQTTASSVSTTTQTWNSIAPTQSQLSQNRNYEYRHPSYENDAQFERAQISLSDEEIAMISATNYAFGSEVERGGGIHLVGKDRRYFANDLRALDLDVKQLQVAYVDSLLVSPIDGVVTGVFRNVGDSVRAAQSVVRVENDAEVLLVGILKFRQMLRIGRKATITSRLFDVDAPLTVDGEVVAVRGHDSENELWDVLIRCNNRSEDGASILPINYNFDFDNTTIDIT